MNQAGLVPQVEWKEIWSRSIFLVDAGEKLYFFGCRKEWKNLSRK